MDAIVDKQCQRRNEQLSEALSALVREELQTEMSRGLRTMQDGTIRVIRDSIRENLSQQLTEISSARYHIAYLGFDFAGRKCLNSICFTKFTDQELRHLLYP